MLRQIHETNERLELFHAEYRLLAKDGRVVVEDQAVAVGRAKDFAIGYLIDITERKEAEAEQAALVEERARLAGELAREKERADLLATASHKLRTPLATVYGGAQTLLSRSLNDKQRDDLLRLRAVIDAIPLAGGLDAGQFDLVLEPTEIRPLGEEAVASACERLPQEMELVLEAPGAPVAWADEERLRQVLDSLLENAIKFSGDARVVRVSLQESDDPRRDRGRRQRHWDPGGGARARLRAVLPHASGARAAPSGHRTRALHRPRARRADERTDHRRVGGRSRLVVRGRAAPCRARD